MKGTTEALCAAGFVLLCFIGVNAFQMWAVSALYGGQFEAGFPVTSYRVIGVGIPWLDTEAVIFNYFIASSVAVHVACGILVLFNARAIAQHFVRRIRKETKRG